MELLQSQKNTLFDLITKAGLSPLQFELIESTGINNETRIVYNNSRYYYRFFEIYYNDPLRVVNFIDFSPSFDKMASGSISFKEWNTQIQMFQSWLDCLKREISQPDKWAELLKSSEDIKWGSQDGENNQFSFQEVEGIYTSVNQAKAKIVQLELSGPQLRLIEAKLDYIAEKAKTLGKIDWKNLMIGTLISLIAQLAVPPETAQTLWVIFKETFQRIILISLH